jgi:uncharacterized membrane protein (DUF4010 family)
MDDLLILQRLGLALALGLIIGLERGWHGRREGEGERAAGLRTFGLAGLLGGAAALLGGWPAAVALAVLLLAVGALLALAYSAEHRNAEEHDRGLTTEVAMLLTIVLGAMAGDGVMLPAVAAAVVAALILNLKPDLHRLVRGLTPEEMRAILRFLLISAVILPLVPDRGFGPDDALNPYQLWLFVVLVCGLSFAGYLAMRFVGAEHGTLLTAVLGALVSSTVVTMSLAGRARKQAELHRIFAAGILAASSIMTLRVLVLLWVVHPLLGLALLPALGPMAAIGILIGLWLWLRRGGAGGETEETALGNPLDLWAAIRFAVLLAVIALASKLLTREIGDSGLYALAAISGLADVDALTLSTAELARGGLALPSAGWAIMIAVWANTLAKAVIVAVIAGPGFAARVALGLALTILASLPGLLAY